MHLQLQSLPTKAGWPVVRLIHWLCYTHAYTNIWNSADKSVISIEKIEVALGRLREGSGLASVLFYAERINRCKT